MTDNSEGKPSRYFRIISGLYELTSSWSTDLSTVLTDFLVDLLELFEERDHSVFSNSNRRFLQDYEFPFPYAPLHNTHLFYDIRHFFERIHTFWFCTKVDDKSFPATHVTEDNCPPFRIYYFFPTLGKVLENS